MIIIKIFYLQVANYNTPVRTGVRSVLFKKNSPIKNRSEEPHEKISYREDSLSRKGLIILKLLLNKMLLIN